MSRRKKNGLVVLQKKKENAIQGTQEVFWAPSLRFGYHLFGLLPIFRNSGWETLSRRLFDFAINRYRKGIISSGIVQSGIEVGDITLMT
jgi:hypothetical protein